MAKKEVELVLLVVFLIMFIGVGAYIGLKDMNNEKVLDLTKVAGQKESPAMNAISDEVYTPEEKKPALEMPTPVYDLFYNNTAIIEIKDYKFFPNEINITVGTNVTWKNIDPKRVYQVYEKAAQQRFNSLGLNPGQSYSYVFNEPGVYYFNDAIFTYMKGVIRVNKE